MLLFVGNAKVHVLTDSTRETRNVTHTRLSFSENVYTPFYFDSWGFMWTISHTYCPYVICNLAILNSQKQQWTYSLFNVSKYSQTDVYWLMPWGMVRETPGRRGRGPFSSGAFCSMAWSCMWFCVSYNKYLHSFVRHAYSCQIA